jgi:hypothetical protein
MTENVLPSENSSDLVEKSARQEKKSSGHISDPEEFGVQEVKPSQNDDTKVEKGGTIDLGKRLDPLERLERFEKLRIRKHLTYSVLSVSIGWIIIGLIHYLLTGNSFLIIAASPMSGPVLIIMGYYFGDQLLQKYVHRGP